MAWVATGILQLFPAYRGWVSSGLGRPAAWVQILVPLLIKCVTLERQIDPSITWFSYLWNGSIIHLPQKVTVRINWVHPPEALRAVLAASTGSVPGTPLSATLRITHTNLTTTLRERSDCYSCLTGEGMEGQRVSHFPLITQPTRGRRGLESRQTGARAQDLN